MIGIMTNGLKLTNPSDVGAYIMKEYHISITEILTKIVLVSAHSKEAAIGITKQRFENGDIDYMLLPSEDSACVEYEDVS